MYQNLNAAFFFGGAAVLLRFKCWHRTGTELLDFSATFLQHKNMAPKSSQVCGIFVSKVLSTLEANVTILESNVTMSEKPKWHASQRATGKSSNKSWPHLMLHTVNCSVA